MSNKTATTELHYRVKEKISVREKFSYGLGDFAGNIIWSSVAGYGVFYYTNSAGIAAAAIGTLFMLSRIFDGFSDILMGLIIDRTHSKHGKARPWLLWMAIPFGLATALMFSVPPSFSPIAKLIYAYITYNLVSTVIFTAINQSYSTLSALITDNVRDRTHLNIARMAMAMICSIAINFMVMPLVNKMGGTPQAWTITFSILGVVAAILFFITFANTKERVHEAVEGESKIEKKHIPVKPALKALFTNKYWVNRVAFGMMITIATGTSGANVYFASYWLGDSTKVGVISLALVFPMIISLTLVTALTTKIGKRNTSVIGIFILIIGMTMQLLAPSSLAMVLLGSAVRGLGTGLATAIIGVMLADTIDYGEWKSGLRTDGLVFSASSFGTKVGSGLSTALLGWMLAWGGFNAAAAAQSGSAMTAILASFTILPLVCSVIALILNLIYNLDKKMPKILDDLRTRSNVQTEA